MFFFIKRQVTENTKRPRILRKKTTKNFSSFLGFPPPPSRSKNCPKTINTPPNINKTEHSYISINNPPNATPQFRRRSQRDTTNKQTNERTKRFRISLGTSLRLPSRTTIVSPPCRCDDASFLFSRTLGSAVARIRGTLMSLVKVRRRFWFTPRESW